MSRMNEQAAQAFHEEIEKLALGPNQVLSAAARAAKKVVTPAAGTALSSGITSGVLGGGIGAGIGAVQGMREGESGTNLWKRIGKGALIGGVGGGALGTAAGKYMPDSIGGALSNLGRRQVYGFTGMVPKGLKKGTKEYADYLRTIGIGTDPKATGKVLDQLARLRGKTVVDQAGEVVGPGLMERARSAVLPAEWNRRYLGAALQKARKGEAVKEEILRSGMASWPGMVQAGIKDPKKLGLLLKDQWYNTGPVGKALTAYGMYETGKGLVGKPREGEGRAESVGSGLGMLLGQAVPMGMPVIPSLIGTSLLTSAGGSAGKGIDYLTGSGRPPTVVPPRSYRSLKDAESRLPPEVRAQLGAAR